MFRREKSPENTNTNAAIAADSESVGNAQPAVSVPCSRRASAHTPNSGNRK